ncbi:Hydroxyacid oxidase 2 [Holothuria leucospilota]|uniref:Hydroxyacid oxidase 2 n=1 Tax=Holothuria leucospilota TaxID=206669 RepID=A0A9Q1BIW5_HOLLE|nr:Hydroxyacid oxidase 2 [Holothuria leucospilota]
MANHNGATSIEEIEKLAEEKSKKDKKLSALWNFINISIGDGQTYDDSFASFKRFRFQPRILSARRERSTWSSLLGNPVRLPVGISPVIGYTFAHPDGDAVAGRATAKAGTVMIMSSVGNLSIEDFASMVPSNGLYWAQTYLFRDKRNTLNLVKNAERLGFKAIVVTVDSPVETKSSNNSAQSKDHFKKYFSMKAKTPGANIKYIKGKERVYKQMSMTEFWMTEEGMTEAACCADWDDLAWLQKQTKLPIVLKGVLSAESARMASHRGISGIIVSAHGGRQLDGVPAPV